MRDIAEIKTDLDLIKGDRLRALGDETAQQLIRDIHDLILWRDIERMRANEAIENAGEWASESLAAGRVVYCARRVMALLTTHGGKIVPHLMDSDDNAGESLRKAITRWETESSKDKA